MEIAQKFNTELGTLLESACNDFSKNRYGQVIENLKSVVINQNGLHKDTANTAYWKLAALYIVSNQPFYVTAEERHKQLGKYISYSQDGKCRVSKDLIQAELNQYLPKFFSSKCIM